MSTIIDHSHYSHFGLFGHSDPSTRTYALHEELHLNSSSISVERWRSEWEENFGNDSLQVQCLPTKDENTHTDLYSCIFYFRIPFSITFVSVIAPVCLHFLGMFLLQSIFFKYLNTAKKLQHSLWTLICPPLFLDWEVMHRESGLTVPIRERC